MKYLRCTNAIPPSDGPCWDNFLTVGKLYPILEQDGFGPSAKILTRDNFGSEIRLLGYRFEWNGIDIDLFDISSNPVEE